LEEDLASQTVSLLTDTPRCHDMEQNARALALRAYAWPVSVQRLCDYYDSVLQASRAARVE
jgi:hypothetical protein